MSNFVTSLIRTYVPIVVGAVLGWLVSIGVEGVDQHQAEAVAGAVAFCQAAWYAAARVLEKRFPQFGWLLGVPKNPTYGS